MWLRRFGFRFGVVFAAILVLPFPLDLIPKTDFLVETYGHAWDVLGHHFGALLGLDVPPSQPTGSGDTMIAWLLMLLSVLIALAIAAIWASVDRRSYPRVRVAVRIALRYWLGLVILGYGLAKVWKTQFPFPSSSRLEQNVGSMSPMGLLWTFMGYSTPYNIFAGCMECLGGALLLFRRTTMAGALVLVPVMTNVVVLNFCYDVPVKLYSATLLGIAIVLLWPDLPRLIAVVAGHAAPPAEIERVALTRRYRRLLLAGKLAVIALAAYGFYGQYSTPALPPGQLDGSYVVVELAPKHLRWDRVTIASSNLAVFHGAQSTNYRLTETEPHTLRISHKDEQESLGFAHAGNTIILDGIWANQPFHAVLRARPPTLLESRGYHWINEFPFNR
jgi:hypothetical protein